MMQQLAGQDAESLTPDQILQMLSAAQESGGDGALQGLKSALSSLKSGSSAPSVGGLISPPVPGDCSTREWKVPAGETFATKEWTLSSGGMKDEGSFILRHKPS